MQSSHVSSDSSFVSESNRILTSIDETDKGNGHEWKNVQPVVVHSSRQLHQAVQQLTHRMDSMEHKMDQLLVAVSTLTQDRHVKEERYASDNRAFSRAWSQLQENFDVLRSDFDRVSAASMESVRVLRDVTIPELERELDAVKEVHRVQSRKEQRIERLEEDGEDLRRRKVDVDEFQKEIRDIRIHMEQMSLFPAFKSSINSNNADGVPGSSSWSDGVVSLSRWLWHGGSLGEGMGKAIAWNERLVRVGEATRWSKTHPQVVKVDREGVYRLCLAVFSNDRDTSVPALSVFINNDAVVNCLSSSSSCVLRRRTSMNRSRSDEVCRRCRVVRCCCDPEPLNALSFNDMLYLPFGSVLTVAYSGDPRNVVEALMELQCLT